MTMMYRLLKSLSDKFGTGCFTYFLNEIKINTMKTENCKKKYNVPLMERVILDNEISLALESLPPDGPNESQLLYSPEYNNNNASLPA